MPDTSAPSPWKIVAGMSKQARGRLKRHVCWMCETRLDHGWCAAIGPRCSNADMLKRMAACLSASRIADVRAVAAALREMEK